MLAANPLGAFSLYAGGNWSMGDVINSTGIPLKWASDVLAAAVIGQTEWTVELALPLEQLGPIGFMSLERVRAPRPNVPELC